MFSGQNPVIILRRQTANIEGNWARFYSGGMTYFRVIRVRQSTGASEEGWAVERSALGEIARIASRVFSTRADAKAEADRLTAQDAQESGN